MKKLFLLLIYFFVFAYVATAQNALPNTDIFICDVSLKNGKYSFTSLKNITNREGYDNQPSFIDNNTIIYTSIREDKQADIYKYDLKTGKITQVTKTPEDEYSPTLMPDGKHISTVRVEADSTQCLWKFPLANPNDFSLILPDVKGVGYHCWMKENELGLFILGEPYTFQLAAVNPKVNNEYNVNIIDSFIGRSIQKVNYNTIAYTSKHNPNSWCIIALSYAFATSSDNYWGKAGFGRKYPSDVYILPEGSEDFIYGHDKAYWVNNGNKLLRFDPIKDKDWKAVFDFKGTPAENFYRIAFSPDGKKLALVSYVGKKP
ncbi:MAG: hypothetical protein EOP00_31795 [Pedobacter sp.]|nr:MAG: hypothetical protein EOP00_31795 [Pedobacter sp.]